MALKPSDSEPAPPRASPTFEWDSETALQRIKEISTNARTTWFGLLALMTFLLVTLLGVQDIDFFGYGRLTQLPIVNVKVPTELFFWAGPPLAAATYAYFHFYLLRLWDALGRAPAKHQGDPFSEHVYPWLLTDAALRRRRDAAAQRRALGSAAALTSLLITWVFGLIVLFFAWWRSLVAHDPALSMLTLACLLFAGTAGMTSWVMLHRRVERRVSGPVARNVWRGWRRRGGRRVVVFLVLVTVLKTWSGHPGVRLVHFGEDEVRLTITSTILSDAIDITRSKIFAGVTLPEFDLPENNLMANADLTEASITIRPGNWLSRTIAEGEARKAWCNRQNLAWDLCIQPPIEPHQENIRLIWCKKHLGADDNAPCETHFAKREKAFQSEWKERRDAYLAVLKKPDLKDRDLRAASMRNAFLPGVNLRRARMDGANLSSAQMEGANLYAARLEGAHLSRARLEGADLRLARLEGANLRLARLEGADLRLARLEGANLRLARLEGADLRLARLEGADLRLARLEGADLGAARLEGADLSAARLEGADLLEANLKRADLRRTQLGRANLREARLGGANLGGARLEGADLRQAGLRGANLTEAQFQSARINDDPALPLPSFSGDFGFSPMNSANFSGATGLTQNMLQLAVGDENTILPVIDGDPLFVWSCWRQRPPNFNALIKMQFPWNREDYKKNGSVGQKVARKPGELLNRRVGLWPTI